MATMKRRLQTDRGLVLRPWQIEDADRVEQAFGDPAMSTQTDMSIHDRASATRWIERNIEAWDNADWYSWAAVDDDLVVGSAMLSSLNRRHEIGWVSYWTCPDARGQGVASSAVRALSDWAFEDLGLFRLELGHRVNNPASRRVAQAAGYTAEGLERKKLRYGSHRFDVELHARLATDPQPSPGTI